MTDYSNIVYSRNVMDFDKAFEKLTHLVKDINENNIPMDTLSEADTRAKIIDVIKI
ncbi:hypothetical protein FACS1894163_11880 [Spirochaetia bacterium]|nr:hypothetical protein FACS1894163_11880 [Spirochaetia bacterium]